MNNNELDAKLREENARLTLENNALKSEVDRWKGLYLSASQELYGKSSEVAERTTSNLFDESELENTQDVLEHTEGNVTEQKVRIYTRKVSQNKTMTLPANTPVVDIYHETIADTTCNRCESSLTETGELTHDTVTFSPATYIIVRHHYPQFRCMNCEPETPVEEGLITAPSVSLLNGTICDPSLLAQIVTDKMHYGLPLYRQEKKLRLAGDQYISRQAQSAWMMYVSRNLIGLSSALERELQRCTLWNMDETGVKILKIPGEKETDSKRNAFMIVRAGTHRDRTPGPVVFNYSDNRRNETIASFIGDYSHVIQSDGLAGYASAAKEKDFTHIGCLVHSRRPVAELAKLKSHKNPLVKELLDLYGKIFHDEGDLTDLFREGALSEEDFLLKRRAVVGKDFDDLKAWLDTYKPHVLKSSKLAKAINYPLDRWESLTRYLDFPFATNSNQKAENAIRPFAVGRKNFLFCITPQGAEASARYYSLVETCKALNIDPQKYFTYLFSNAASCTTDSQWDAMLPHRVDLSAVDEYYDTLKTATPDPDRKEPYLLRGKKR